MKLLVRNIKSSIVKSSVLPTIDKGIKVFGNIYGEIKSFIDQENNII